jgi:cyclohexanecarboxylate-CoA ligase
VEATRTCAIDELIAVWGMTENGAVTMTRPGSPVAVVADSDGVPVEWMQVRVVDEKGETAPVGQPGRLLTRGASQTIGYFKRPDLYQAQLSPADDDQGDWFDTGDLARGRDDGGIRISGRTKDLVIRGGENVPVVEVERLGERACAVVIPDGVPPTLEELTMWLADAGMAKQFWPERLELVDSLPKTPSGKVQKFHLREQFSR